MEAAFAQAALDAATHTTHEQLECLTNTWLSPKRPPLCEKAEHEHYKQTC